MAESWLQWHISVMELNVLCGSCNKFDVGAIGFYGPDHLRFHVYSIRDRALDEIMQNLEKCILCRKIAELFREWNIR